MFGSPPIVPINGRFIHYLANSMSPNGNAQIDENPSLTAEEKQNYLAFMAKENKGERFHTEEFKGGQNFFDRYATHFSKYLRAEPLKLAFFSTINERDGEGARTEIIMEHMKKDMDPKDFKYITDNM